MSQLRFNPRSTSIIVTATISGKRGSNYADLVLDTGASIVMLPWNLVQAIGIPIDPNNTIKTTTASSVETSPRVTIPSMSVMGYAISNIDCIVRDLPPDSHIDGLLGLSFLRHFNLTLDFKQGILTLKPF